MKGRNLLIYSLICCFIVINACNSDSTSKDGIKSDPSSIATAYPKGQELFNSTCKVCHQENGEGLPNTFPPLAKSDYLLSDKARAIRQVINGSSGDITVNGLKYNGTMPPQALSDEEIAAVLNYVYHTWGNDAATIKVEEVRSLH